MPDPPSPSVPRKQHERFSEGAKFLPVAFVVFIILGLYMIYICLHIWPLLNNAQRHGGAVEQCLLFNVITFLLATCYIRSMLIHPGTIPDKSEDPDWEFVPMDSRGGSQALGDSTLGITQETKRSGDRRHCKWCAKYKPDRCHHCRICRTCVLKMDHHCPWIYNCVGFRNHKYFFLLVFYAAVDCHFIVWTMLDTARSSMASDTPFMRMFLVLFCWMLAALIGTVVTFFFGFHVWLMSKSMTTIEFCEKQTRRGYDESAYDRGTMGNIMAVLGDYPILWLLPCSAPSGDGLHFTEEMGFSPLLPPVSDDVSHPGHSLYQSSGNSIDGLRSPLSPR